MTEEYPSTIERPDSEEIMLELSRVICRQMGCENRGDDRGRCAFCADVADYVLGTYFKLKAAGSWSSMETPF
jgi:hypothetical protein